MKKKIINLICLILVVCMFLCACGTNNKQNTANKDKTTEVTSDTTTNEDSTQDSNTTDEVANSNDDNTVVDNTDISVNQSSNANNTTKPSDTTKPNNTTNQQHSHSYSNATCTEPKKCSCGATSGSALGHNYSNATCTEAKKCTRCGATSGSALGHNYSNGTCTRCGNKKETTVVLPSTPATVSCYGSRNNLLTQCTINSISYKIARQNHDGTVDIEFTFKGTSLYSYAGASGSAEMRFAYKLYDSDGYVIYSGLITTSTVAVGEKFIATDDACFIPTGDTYTFELCDRR